MNRISTINRRTTNSCKIGSCIICLFLLLLSQQVTYGNPWLLAIKSQTDYADIYKNYPDTIDCELNSFYNFKFHGSFILDEQDRTAIDLGIEDEMATNIKPLNWQRHQAEDYLWSTTQLTNYKPYTRNLSLEDGLAPQDTSDRLIGWRPSPKWKISLISQFHYDDYPAAFSPKEIMSYSEDERKGAYLQFSWLY